MSVQFTLALRYLNGRKLRSFLTTLAVIFGVLVIFSMNIMLPSMMQSFQATMMAASNNVDLTVSHSSGEPFDASLVGTVRGVDGVRAAQGILSRSVNLPMDFYDHNPNQPDAVSVVSLVGLDPEAAQSLRNYSVQSGRFLQPGDTTACVIAQTLADNLALKAGDTLPLPTTKGQVDLTIAGILPPRTIPGNEEVLVALPEAQSLMDAAGQVNAIEADYATTDEARRAEIQKTIEAKLGSGYQFGALSNSSDTFANLKMAQAIFTVFGALALFMGGFIIFNTFRTLVAERRRDIGMLRAVGANRRTITGLVLMEGLLQGVTGTALGMALGYLVSLAAIRMVSGILNSYVHFLIGALVVPPALVVITIVLGIGITLIAGLLPALSAGRITPMEALRPAVAGVEYRKAMGWSAAAGAALVVVSLLALISGNMSLISLGAFLFLAGLILVAPALVRPIAAAFGALIAWTMAREGTGTLAQGNLNRQPTRAAITASTTMIALAILVVVGGLTTTLRYGFLGVLKQSLGSDYLFIPPSIGVWGNDVGADSSFTEQLKAVKGVGPVSTFRFATTYADLKPAATIKGTPASDKGVMISLMGIDPVTFPQVSGMRFDKGTAAEAFPALGSERALIANGVFASTAGLKIGDVVPLITPNGRQNYRVAAIAGDYLNAKIVTAYISQANMAADFKKSEDIFIQLNLAPGADRAQVEPQLKAIKQQYPQFAMISGQAYFQQTVTLFNTAFAGMYIFFIFLTIPSLIAMLNTLAIGVIERTREIGMLRAVGATQKQVRRMILAEALLLALVGTAFGLLAGMYLSYVMTGAFRLGGFPMDFYFPWAGLVYATAVGLLFGALAALLPARQAARLPIVQALRYE